MKGFDLFRAYRLSQYGFDPIVYGINMARLGLDRNQVLHNYTINYGEEFFIDFIRGYNNAFDEEFVKDLELVVVPEIDIDFVMNNVRKHKLMTNFIIDTHTEYNTDSNMGLYDSVMIKCEHKLYAISFKITYHRNISVDSSTWSYWHIEATVKHNLQQMRFTRGSLLNVEELVWNENLYRQSYNCGKNECGYWYELVSKQNRFRIVPHSSDVVKLLDKLVDLYVKQYGLEEKKSTTLAETARIIKQK